MRLLARLRSWWRATVHASRMEAEMEAEMLAHLEAHAGYLRSTGVSAEEAGRRARLEFGAPGRAKEACRDARGANWAPSLAQDLSFGLRMLRKSPGFAVLSIVTLGLGIGAATAVFSVVDSVLLRALPYRDPDRLVYLWEPNPRLPNIPLEAWAPNNADFYDWKNQNHSFAGMALFTTEGVNLVAGGTAVRISASRVTGEFFATLGIAAELGRVLGPADDRPGAPRVAVIGHALWQSRLAADPHVVGRELILDARPYQVVGVMPPGFAFPHGAESIDTAHATTEIWAPLAFSEAEKADRNGGPGTAIGRLKPGVPVARAESDIGAITAGFDHLHTPEMQGCITRLEPFDAAIVGSARRALLIFLAAVVVFLLIAASNVSSLVLARAQTRARELALRAALGASRRRLIRQLSTEALVLAGAGGALGIAVAWLATRLLVRFHPANIPRLDETSVDGRVLLAALAATLGGVIFCGLFPAWSSSRADLNEVMKRGGSRAVSGGRLDRALIVAQVALTFVLLAGSGLLIRSFRKVESIDKGFEPAYTATTSVQLDSRYDQPARRRAFFRQLLERVRGLPGVEKAAAGSHVPLGGGQSLSLIEVEGFGMDMKTLFEVRDVTPGYFAAMGIPLLEGRAFTDGDVDGQPVIIVSRSFARQYYPGQSALGKRVHTNGHRVIVGVVGDVRQWKLEETPPMQFYLPLDLDRDSLNLVVRTHREPTRVAADVRAVVRQLDSAVAVADVRTGDELVAGATAERRFQMLLLAAFGAMALFFSMVGLYALMSYAVERRTAEIGIRMALGGRPANVLGGVMTEGVGVALAGIALGIACSGLAARAMVSLLFGVEPWDVPALGAAAGLFTLVALAACFIPARRATRVDPLVCLRAE